MSTRCMTIFKENGKNVAAFYRHHDGYPDGQGQDLCNFLVKADTEKPLRELAREFKDKMNEGEKYPVIEDIATYTNLRETPENLAYEKPEDIFRIMTDTDWEYVYLVEKNDGSPIDFSILNHEEVLFNGAPRSLADPSQVPGMSM